ncbi:thiamine diphosphokinase [Pediococcus claussenii]|uniref:Thiamine diphosphokinase n=1 Tax=Pediococcus claussenii (strain ATCC BAA-344 / DSM 14800 / JCM 18046 / KCTC 3811 / LMG 21948 / P06) TaxID=701521 RepID=G8PDH8_PEDCP|nr:thiamine diphosphokinase [Pediococcus claussenii]AEV95313.1 thiamine pyrophosphokinase [Pediococcus claussenii ATCC BAA-344]ANZ68846.1 thiamine pyrophosphokinase [Pediococcus claussenii]ANZ70662.1 thiamine pyrophosphokinase [Pediococcus claussenii]KRN19505.1 hypothetical protein IV79_GL001222 [Pediococcus claussenii]
MARVNILIGGPTDQIPVDWETVTGIWIGVDRGSLRLVKAGISPALSLGDFDSIDEEDFQLVQEHSQKVLRVNEHKDDTDTELALKLVQEEFLDAEEVVVYGATGGRMDHLLSNIFAVLQPRFKDLIEKITLIDRQNLITFYHAGNHVIRKQMGYKYLGFVLLTGVTDLNLIDEKYTLDNYSCTYPRAFGSNEFIGNEAHFNFASGIVAAIQSRDLPKV